MQNTKIRPKFLAKLYGLLIILRPKQWIKNGFVLAPLIFTGKFLNSADISQALLAVIFFCIASSAAYIINDIYDINHDRLHPKKSLQRPLAARLISIPMALVLLLVLYVLLIGSWFILPSVVNIIIAYLLLNLAYTFVLKHQPVLDMFTIAIGFVLRVYAGGEALQVPISAWMFVTTLCLALYLAAVKRRQELMQSPAESRAVLKKYSVGLIDRYAEMSATGALIFYSLFVMSAKPQLIMTIPLVLFSLFRYWYVVETLDGGECPTDALLSDWQLILAILLWLVMCGWVLWPQ